MSNKKQLIYINKIQNQNQNLYYADNKEDINNIELQKNDRFYIINDNQLYQVGEGSGSTTEEIINQSVTFNKDDNTTIDSLVVDLEPEQDLNGYIKPWPKGAINLYDSESNPIEQGAISGSSGKNASTTSSYNAYRIRTNGLIDIGAGISYTISTNFPLVYLCYLGANGLNNFIGNSGGWHETPYTFTPPENTAKLRLMLAKSETTSGAGAITVTPSDFEWLQIEKGTQATSYVPYSNICPIYQQSECDINTIKNLASNVTWVSGYYDDNGNIKSSSYTVREPEFLPVMSGRTYCVQISKPQSNTYKIRVQEYDKDKNWLRQSVSTTDFASYFMTGQNTAYIRFSIPVVSTNIVFGEINQIIKSLEIDGEGIYGGTLDLLTGELIVDRIGITVLNVDAFNNLFTRISTSYKLDTTKVVYSNLLAYWDGQPETMPINSFSFSRGTNDNYYINIKVLDAQNDSFSMAQQTNQILSQWNGEDTPLQIIIGITNPQKYQLDPDTVQISEGINIVSTDIGKVHLKLTNNGSGDDELSLFEIKSYT